MRIRQNATDGHTQKQHRRHTLDLLGQRKAAAPRRSALDLLGLGNCFTLRCPRRQLGRGRRICVDIVYTYIYIAFTGDLMVHCCIIFGTLLSKLLTCSTLECWSMCALQALNYVDYLNKKYEVTNKVPRPLFGMSMLRIIDWQFERPGGLRSE